MSVLFSDRGAQYPSIPVPSVRHPLPRVANGGYADTAMAGIATVGGMAGIATIEGMAGKEEWKEYLRNRDEQEGTTLVIVTKWFSFLFHVV